MLGAKIKSVSDLTGMQPTPKELVEKLQSRYEIDSKWREAWCALANKFERNRLQSRQEAIERKATLANNRIRVLMLRFDAACT